MHQLEAEVRPVKLGGNHVCEEGALFGVYVCVFDGRDY